MPSRHTHTKSWKGFEKVYTTSDIKRHIKIFWERWKRNTKCMKVTSRCFQTYRILQPERPLESSSQPPSHFTAEERRPWCWVICSRSQSHLLAMPGIEFRSSHCCALKFKIPRHSREGKRAQGRVWGVRGWFLALLNFKLSFLLSPNEEDETPSSKCNTGVLEQNIYLDDHLLKEACVLR